MKYETHCDRDINTEGVVLQGELICDYDTLVKFFGQPLDGNGITSISAEWHILFQNAGKEVVSVIYDSYPPKKGENQRFWEVSGLSRDAYRYVLDILDGHTEEEFEDDD